MEPGAGDSYGMDISASEAKLSGSTYMVGASGGLDHGFLFMDEVLETSGAYASSSSYARAARTGAASKDSFETRDVLGGMAIHHYARMPAHAESHYGAKTPFVMLTFIRAGPDTVWINSPRVRQPPEVLRRRCGAFTCQNLPGGRGEPSETFGGRAELIFSVLCNHSSAKEAPLAQCVAPVAFRRPGPG